MYRRLLTFSFIFCLFFLTDARAGQCTEYDESGDDSYSAYVSVPAGESFDRTDIIRVDVLQVKAAGNKAAVIAQVKTVSGEGKLRLGYEYVVDEWILKNIENLNFREH